MKAKRIERLLPNVFQRTVRPDGLLNGLLEVMAELHRPCEEELGRLDALLDPRRTPDRFVPFLARWVHLEHLHEDAHGRGGAGRPCPAIGSIGRLRELVAEASFLAQWRGTKRGLLRLLTVATGCTPFAVEEQVRGSDGALRPFHLRITAPAAAATQRDLVHKLVRMGKPAHVTYELAFTEGGR